METRAMKLLLNKNQFVYNIALYQVGYEKCSSLHSYGPVVRDFYVMHLLVSGSGYLESEGKRIALKKGDLFLVPVDRSVRYYANREDPYEYYWVGFYGTNAMQLMNIIGFLKNNKLVISSGESFDNVRSLFEKMAVYNDGRSVKENLIMLGYFYQIIGALTPGGIETGSLDENETTLNKLLRYIEFNYNTDITMETLESVASMHRSNIYKLFKKTQGVSPTQYIANYRLDKALYLLKNTDYSLKKIASLVGYKNSAYLCRIFHKRHKKTPLEARKLN